MSSYVCTDCGELYGDGRRIDPLCCPFCAEDRVRRAHGLPPMDDVVEAWWEEQMAQEAAATDAPTDLHPYGGD